MNTTAEYTAFQKTIAGEALQVHDAGCCTEDARCEIGRGLECVVHNTRMTADIHPDADRTLPRGDGHTGHSTPARGVRLATVKQMAYVNSLLGSIASPATDRVRAAHEMVSNAIAKDTQAFGGLKMDSVDLMLTVLKAAVAEQRAARPVAAPVHTAPAPAQRTPLTEGMYEMDGAVYRAKLSEAGRLYAMLLVVTDGNGSFKYAPGIVNRLRAEHRMPLERASQLSVQYHFCVRCTKELTKKSSIAQGMGDWCAARM